MSRIGKKYIEIPQGVNVSFNDNVFVAKSNKGELSYIVPTGIRLTIEDNKILLKREVDTKTLKSLHGL
ncbi:MAG: 50S ribosomal protein L6, partial [Thermodesulfovibrionales bacterium]|nr:50S ribosomal protein L6 [Thermodesulfovibrionales bacterium]